MISTYRLNSVSNINSLFLRMIHNYLWGYLSYSDADYIESTPSFVSGWINMTANSATSEQTILHGLQELPMMVRVDAKTEEGWIFTGFGSAQKDDDGGYTYGGVVFIYSNTSIKIFVPKRSNDRSTATWTALYLGL